MKKRLHKSKVGTHLSYVNGNYTNNLNCDNVSIDISPNNIIFSVDLGCNLRVRNKQSNCYSDVNEFAEERAQLKMFQIFDEISYKVAAEAFNNNENAKWFLEIIIGDKGSYTYEVTVKGENDQMMFLVKNK